MEITIWLRVKSKNRGNINCVVDSPRKLLDNRPDDSAPQKWRQIRESSERVQREIKYRRPPSFWGERRVLRREEGDRFPFHAATPRPSFHATMASVPRQKAKHPKYWRKSYCPPVDRTLPLKCREREREKVHGHERGSGLKYLEI